MVMALDSCILIDIVEGTPQFSGPSLAALRHASAVGVNVLSDVAYAEVCAAFATHHLCERFLSELGVKVESLSAASSFAASRSWLSYLQAGGKRTRILPDFLIAAHAIHQADSLMTRDHGFYRSHFSRLSVINPTER